MDQHLLWQRVNKLIAYQKQLDTFLFQQKHIIADLILRVQYLEKLNNVKEEEFNAYKEEFITKHEKSKVDPLSDCDRPSTTGANVSDDRDSGLELPRN